MSVELVRGRGNRTSAVLRRRWRGGLAAVGAFGLAAFICSDIGSSVARAEPAEAGLPPEATAPARFKEIAAALASGDVEATRTGLVRLRSEPAQGQYVDLLIGALERGG